MGMAQKRRHDPPPSAKSAIPVGKCHDVVQVFPFRRTRASSPARATQSTRTSYPLATTTFGCGRNTLVMHRPCRRTPHNAHTMPSTRARETTTWRFQGSWHVYSIIFEHPLTRRKTQEPSPVREQFFATQEMLDFFLTSIGQRAKLQ